jgi:hypothetical protein
VATAGEVLQHPGWPGAVMPILQRAVTVEYASLTRVGTPIMVPVTPYAEPGARTLDVSTGLTYPAKAERARRNPKVGLLFADHVGAGLTDVPVVLVQGLATVRDTDLQANTDRYVRLTLAKSPEMFRGQPRFLLRRLDWYFARIWIQVTPIRIWWWPSKALDQAAGLWVARPATTAPPSDPAPAGRPPAAWLEAPTDWRAAARSALARLDQRDLGWVGADGFPLAVPVAGVEQVEHGLRLDLGHHLPAAPQGPACLTVHSHPVTFTRQENHSFVGEVSSTGPDAYLFRVQRLLADVSLAGNKLTNTLGFLAKGRRLAPRLEPEAARRGQRVPKVRHPRDRDHALPGGAWR